MEPDLRKRMISVIKDCIVESLNKNENSFEKEQHVTRAYNKVNLLLSHNQLRLVLV